MLKLRVWQCRCGHDTTLPPGMAERMQIHLKSSPTEPVLDFVCPDCGFGTRRALNGFEPRDFPSLNSYSQPTYHVDAKCKHPGCANRVTLHTAITTYSPTATPKIAPEFWKLEGILCQDEHPLKSRITITGEPRRMP